MDLPGRTVEELIYHWSRTDPETEAFVALKPDASLASSGFLRLSLTRLDVHVLCRKFAATLRQAGIGKGDVVCVALNNCLERVVADLGTICCAAVALNGQILRADGEDFLQALNSARAKAVVLDPSQPRGAWSILQHHVSLLDADVTCPSLPHLRRVMTARRSDDPRVDFFSRLRAFPKALERAHALTSDVAVIWTTSGSTGFSKLVTQTHANLLHIALQVRHIARLGRGDKIVNCAPLGWAGGFPSWFLGSGATRVFVDTSRGPPDDLAAAVWEAVQREKAAYLFASPAHVASVLQRPELWRGESLWRPRGINLAGQPMKRSLVVGVLGRLCSRVDINYGATECGVIATLHLADCADYEDGLTGPPALGVRVRIADAAGGDVPRGQKGEIYAQSPALHGRYVGNEAAAERAFTPDLWFRTDDVGYLRPDGQIVHLGRRSDVITRGVYLCYPGWLESLLRRCPGVRDVCVVPVPDPVLHQEICACVVPATGSPVTAGSGEDPGGDDPARGSASGGLGSRLPSKEFEESLRTFADSLLLTRPGEPQHLTPKYYVIMTSLPMTPTGKVIRKDVSVCAQRQLGLADPIGKD